MLLQVSGSSALADSLTRESRDKQRRQRAREQLLRLNRKRREEKVLAITRHDVTGTNWEIAAPRPSLTACEGRPWNKGRLCCLQDGCHVVQVVSFVPPLHSSRSPTMNCSWSDCWDCRHRRRCWTRRSTSWCWRRPASRMPR